MKKIFLISILSLSFINCSDNAKEENTPITPSTFDVSKIRGNWQYVEELDYNPPGPYLITDGPILHLKADGTFTSTQNPNYSNGLYTVSSDSIITLNYISDSDIYIKKKKINYLTTNEIILDNDYLWSGVCTEGCAERYSRVIN